MVRPMSSFRLGVAGLIHGHVGSLLQQADQVEGLTTPAVADDTPLLDHYRSRFERTYPAWPALLDGETLDGLLVTSDNAESSRIAVEALGRGIPCFVEKPMAARAADAQAMKQAAEASGTPLFINWPMAWTAWFEPFTQQIQAEEFGPVFHLRYRNGHHGPREIGCDPYFVGWLYDEERNGGGALADFGGYGAALAAYLFGLPDSVTAVRHNATKDYDVPDDHALILLRYPKRTVLIEGTWATFGFESGPNPVAYGSRGTLGSLGGQLEFSRAGKDRELTDLAPSGKNPLQVFVDVVLGQASLPAIVSPEVGLDACRIIDAARLSSDSGRAEAP
jgi:predicted dehydrogenase